MEGYGLDWEPPLSHGFKVGLGTIAVSALFERVLSKDLSSLVDIDGAVAAWPSWQETEAKVRRVVREDLQDRALTQTKAKYVGSAELRVRLERLVENWPRIHRRLREQLLSTAELQAKLDAVGAVSHPSQIMMPMDRLRATYDRARWIRSRYVLSDMLTEANLFDALVDELFAPGGYWAERRPLPPAL